MVFVVELIKCEFPLHHQESLAFWPTSISLSFSVTLCRLITESKYLSSFSVVEFPHFILDTYEKKIVFFFLKKKNTQNPKVQYTQMSHLDKRDSSSKEKAKVKTFFLNIFFE
jgi:hypothetical protein